MKQNTHKFLLFFVFFFVGLAFTQDQNGALPATGLAVVEADIEGWQLLTLRHTAHENGNLTVEIFNYTYDANTGHSPAVFFDDWQIEITKPATPEIVQEVHYDPWGLVMQDESYSTADNTNILFNSKELQTFADLNFYDYHWRQYDPQLGRWHNIDPSADKYHGFSPYNYCFNNPVMIIDPDGRDPITAAILIGAGIGALMGGADAAIRGDNVLIGTLRGAIIGGISGGVGAVVQGAFTLGSVGSYVLAYGTSGLAAGAVSGGLEAAMTGGNVLNGILRGAVIGGLTGAATGAIFGGINYAKRINIARRALIAQGYDPNGAVNMTDEDLLKFVQAHEELNTLYQQGGKPELIAGTPTDSYTINADGNFTSKRIILDSDGNIVKNAGVGGTTSLENGTIRIAPSRFKSAIKLYMTTGHELHHAMHVRNGVYGVWTAIGGEKFAERMSETVAHKWGWQLGKKIGMVGVNAQLFNQHNRLLPVIHRIKLNFLRP
jgi:RHS repeat-associated protein